MLFDDHQPPGLLLVVFVIDFLRVNTIVELPHPTNLFVNPKGHRIA
jgi:hypothetical protein